MEVKEIDEVEELQERRAPRRTGWLGGGVVDESRPMLPWIISFVKYDYSTSISQVGIFVRTISQGEENKGVELTGVRGTTGRRRWRACEK